MEHQETTHADELALLTPRQAAGMLGCSPNGVYRLIAGGELQAVNIAPAGVAAPQDAHPPQRPKGVRRRPRAMAAVMSQPSPEQWEEIRLMGKRGFAAFQERRIRDLARDLHEHRIPCGDPDVAAALRELAGEIEPAAGWKIMSTDTLGYPAQLRDRLKITLPQDIRSGPVMVHMEPKDKEHRKCAAWAADHYEVAAFYASMGPSEDFLYARLEEALRELPETYLTTQLQGHGDYDRPGMTLSNPDWPVRYPQGNTLRQQVRALMRDSA